MGTDMKTKLERIPLEVFNQGNFGLIDELIAPLRRTLRAAGRAADAGGLQAVRDGLQVRLPGPSLHGRGHDRRGRHDRAAADCQRDDEGRPPRIPASGTRATWTEIHIGRVDNGQLVEHWVLVDQLGMLVQLGIVPAPGQVPVSA